MQTFNVKSLLNTVNNSLLNRVKKSLLNRVENSLLNRVNTIKRLKPLIANTLNPIFQSKSLLSLSYLCYFTNKIGNPARSSQPFRS